MQVAVRSSGRIVAALRSGSWMVVPGGIGLISRIYSIVVIVWADRQRAGVIPNPFTMWDGLWYLSIAGNGYHPAPIVGSLRDIAFFPGWPMLMRFGTPAGWDMALVAPAMADLLLVLACILVWRVLADRLGSRVATPAVAFLAFSPASYVLSLAYSEPLFLCLAASAFLLRGRTIPRMLAVAAAMATRIAGSGLVLAALVEAVLERGRARRSAFLAAVAGAVAFGAWWTFVGVLEQDPFGFLKGSASWGYDSGPGGIVGAIQKPEVHTSAWLAYYAVAVWGAVVVARRDRLLGAFALGCVALAVLPGSLVSSMPRYAISAFPAFAGLAIAFRGRAAWLGVGAFAAAQVLFTYWAIVETRAP